MNEQHTTQLDYVKILLEEDRSGEALNHLKDICRELETKCLVTANKLKDLELDIPKSLIKTKPLNWKQYQISLILVQINFRQHTHRIHLYSPLLLIHFIFIGTLTVFMLGNNFTR